MSSRPELKLDWCSAKAARYAVEHWHYSQTMPRFKTVKIGVWEDGAFIGAVIFGNGAGQACNGKRYGLPSRHAVAELARMALRQHSTPVSRVLAIARRMVVGHCPRLRLLVSFADASRGHHGGIYQADGWIYAGKRFGHDSFVVHGKVEHTRTLGGRYGYGGQGLQWLREHVDSKTARGPRIVKHRYLYPLDAEMRARIEPLSQPYPKRAGSADSGTPDNQSGGGGASPTSALCSSSR